MGEAARRGGKAQAIRFDGGRSALSAWRATFVTLTQGGKLRGCIGSFAPRRPLIEDAAANAVEASFSDPRFAPLDEAELDGLRVDVSILSHPRLVPWAGESDLLAALEPDRDGLILGAGDRRALFLPSVWRDVRDPRMFVRLLKAKAGLDENGWPEGLRAERFRVESFGAPWRRVDPQEIAPLQFDGARVLH
jgi:AmmeMemoRadiSam system protein A